MVDTGKAGQATSDLGLKIVYFLTVSMVIIGLINATPGIPGYDDLVARITGIDGTTFRKFPFEWFYPSFFALMMLIVALKHSMWRAWAGKALIQRQFGLFMDIALVVMAATISVTYFIEIEAICLIDQFTGDRARLIAESLNSEKEMAELLGMTPPTTVDDPQCVNTTGGWLVLIVGLAITVFLSYNVKVWGFPLVLVAILIASYTIITVLVWYFHGPDDINKYLMTKLAGEPRILSDGRPRIHDILINNSSGMLGRFMDIVLNTIFPYLVLGSLFGSSAGGRSLIKVAFRLTRNLRGGPAHAAVVSSAMFGTISGGPIVNVLSTGVLTIPMMIKRGFSKTFAGGVEAAASSGGSIMPPVMGVAAFVLAALTAVPYSSVIIAAVIPALCYFFCLFLSVVFQSRKQKIEAIGELTEDMHLDFQDLLNLIMILAPILLILLLLLTDKGSVGCGFFSGMMGAERIITVDGCNVISLSWGQQLIQNAAGDAGSAGWMAVLLLMALLFVDPEVRAKPKKIVDGLSQAGVLISTLYLMFLAVSIIDFCLNFTGLPTFLSLDVLQWLQSLNLGNGGPVVFQLVALLLTMFIAILLGMGMPAVPAYINVALLMGPVLAGLGISTFTAHMFIFYFAVASAITPPVALAAFAAATITNAGPMGTAFSAVKSGIVMFIIPFVFAFYPEILLIEDAVIDAGSNSGGAIKYLADYTGTLDLGVLAMLLFRLAIALYLISSSLSRFDSGPLGPVEVVLRIGLAMLLLFKSPLIFSFAIVGAVLVVGVHQLRHRGIIRY
jgi:TRAP transporter 4TM/12TM fusion protein|tara:strand:+ start:2352 stop:4703 length:2352 start_codon:yes stop_codon:yes gene_type:complete